MPRKVFVAGEVLTAADVNTNLMDQSVMVFADSGARGSAIGSPSEGMVTYLEDSDSLEVYGGTATGWVHTASAGTPSYRYVDTVYYTSNGTFSKGDYPWLRAIRVKVQGAGGGGSGAKSNPGEQAVGRSGGGGGYAESFITDIAGLSSSETVTIGSGGSGGAATPTGGANGGTSSFGSVVSASGGDGGVSSLSSTASVLLGSNGGRTNTGDLTVDGGASGYSVVVTGSAGASGKGGDSFLGAGGTTRQTSANGDNGNGYGGGGSAGCDRDDTGRIGGDGADGIVIVELYA